MNQNTTEHHHTFYTSRTRILAEVIIFVALATALSFVVVYVMPQGGSITAGSMVPLIWLSLRRGPKIGVTAGILYGLMQFVFLPYAVDPVQVLLDYPLAFGVLASLKRGFRPAYAVASHGLSPGSPPSLAQRAAALGHISG